MQSRSDIGLDNAIDGLRYSDTLTIFVCCQKEVYNLFSRLERKTDLCMRLPTHRGICHLSNR